MKAVLSNRIYMNANSLLYAELEKELTYVFPRYNPTDPPEVIKNISKINHNLVTIPIGRVDLIPEGYRVIDNTMSVPAEFPEFRFDLRPNQQEIYNQVEGSCIINANPAWGKTFTGLAIAGKLQQKTLVVVHNVSLRNQWEREVEKVYGIEPSVIGSGRVETNGPITVGNIQALYRNIPLIKQEFGTVILDEMHHVSANTFSRLIDTNYAMNKIGLSATTKRKDGKHVMFNDYFSQDRYLARKENSKAPEVHIIKTDIRFPDGARTPWAVRVNKLVQNENYIRLVSQLSATYAALGHNVLTLADRVHFLEQCQRITGDSSLVIVGKTPEREAELAKMQLAQYNILYGTQAIFAEGINQPLLSCLVLGTPINNDPLLEQLIGRIERLHPGKKDPVLVDIHLVGKTARSQASARMNYYISKGYKIKQIA